MKFTTRCLRKVFKDALSADEFHIAGKIFSIDDITEDKVLTISKALEKGDLVEIFGDYKDERVHLEVIQTDKFSISGALGKVLQDSSGNNPDKCATKRFRINDITRIFKVIPAGELLEDYKKTA